MYRHFYESSEGENGCSMYEAGYLIDTNQTGPIYRVRYYAPHFDDDDIESFIIEVDISAPWIDKEEVTAYIRMDESNYDEIKYVIGCVETYTPGSFDKVGNTITISGKVESLWG